MQQYRRKSTVFMIAPVDMINECCCVEVTSTRCLTYHDRRKTLDMLKHPVRKDNNKTSISVLLYVSKREQTNFDKL